MCHLLQFSVMKDVNEKRRSFLRFSCEEINFFQVNISLFYEAISYDETFSMIVLGIDGQL